ncbi:hypothetical protein TEA_018121 [Camellia sinensis var. sinensis]|uniref:Protein kinase domain-containing protein n=1 Tax=Camellia sinensis var. sinensis TaxID=542762 RepID=A0A4S4DBU2_CAMSN|nr:hypothetical protein TEA_018121 [Camellia sinensis var. sinensis]
MRSAIGYMKNNTKVSMPSSFRVFKLQMRWSCFDHAGATASAVLKMKAATVKGLIATVKGVFGKTNLIPGSQCLNSPSQIPETSSQLLTVTHMLLSKTSIPMGVTSFQFTLSNYSNHTNVLGFNPCSYAFVPKETAYNFSLDLKDFQGREKLPVVFDWAVGYQTCDKTKGIQQLMLARITTAIVRTNNNGYEGDGLKNGTGCNPIPVPDNRLPLINIALGKGRSSILKRNFQQNGGIMLQQRSKCEGSVQSAKIITADDLKKATNNYHVSRVLGQGGQGTVYKGILSDNTIVAIEKSKVADQSQTRIEQFINEVVILSQVNHTNVVKLLGCCLETQVPLLVYEFITDGTLYYHIHAVGHNTSSIAWENRLRIATETATALSYLHPAASTPIIHRDVKSTNILLDDNYIAKVSDFGASRLIPIDQSQLTTLVQGKLGYLDPEYFHTSQLSEKSDVYGFGAVLVELLTGKRNLTKYFVSSMKENHLFVIVDEQVMNEVKADQLKEVSILAKRCLRVKGNERPTMKEVAMQLEGLRMMEKHPWVDDNKNLEETLFAWRPTFRYLWWWH